MGRSLRCAVVLAALSGCVLEPPPATVHPMAYARKRPPPAPDFQTQGYTDEAPLSLGAGTSAVSCPDSLGASLVGAAITAISGSPANSCDPC